MEPTFAQIVLKYLAWSKRHRSRRTLEWYANHLANFITHLGDQRNMPISSLKPFHIVEWVDSKETWGNTYKRGAIVAVQRACNFAEELGYIEFNPVKKVRKPPAARRDNPMSPEDYQAILALLPDGDPFREILTFVWHTGCRPQEARHLEQRHVHLDRECVIIPKAEAKGQRAPRVIHLHGPALAIVQRLMTKQREGKLFLNARGGPWEKYAVANRMDRLSKRIGKRLAMYDARHGFCQRLLEAGVGHVAVAELMGHANAQMVSTVYSHMHKATGHLKDALRQADALSSPVPTDVLPE